MKKFISIKTRLTVYTMGIISVIFLAVLSIVTYINILTVNRSMLKSEHNIRNSLIARGNTLIHNNSIALAGLVSDNAFGDIRNLVASTVKQDADMRYGIYMNKSYIRLAYAVSDKADDDDQIVYRSDDEMAKWAGSLTHPDNKVYAYKNDEEVIEFAAPIIIQEQILGFIRYGISTKSMQVSLEDAREDWTNTRNRIILALMLLGFLSLMISYVIVRRLAITITSPIATLVRFTKTIASANYDMPDQIITQDELKSDDELGQLAAAFNQMSEELRISFVSLKNSESRYRNLSKELEHRVRSRTAQLEAANKELESFTYSVSHDLRAPLRGIDGWTLALAEDCADLLDEQGKKYIDRVRREVQRMVHLIEDMLNLSRMTRTEINLTPVNLSELGQSVIDGLRETDPDRRVEVIIEPDLTANCDKGMMSIVLNNLFGNSWKFTGKTPMPKIEFGKAEPQPETKDTKDVGRQIFFIRDNGAGFDKAYASKLFGAFQRLHNARDFPGTGIGLAIVQRIIHRHGGRVWAEAAVNQGATFYFTL